MWTVSELNKLHDAVYKKDRAIQDVIDLYRQWGGCVRWVLEKPKKESEKLLEDDVNASSADDLLAACTGYNNDKVIAPPVPLKSTSFSVYSFGRSASLCHQRSSRHKRHA